VTAIIGLLVFVSACSGTPTGLAGGANADATSAPKTGKWVTVAKLSGSGNKRSDDFTLEGGQARLTYTVKENPQFPVFSVYIVESGHSLQKEGGFPEVMVTEAGKDTTRLAQGPGTYYLDVSAANATWSVLIEEQR
jgi:hypothetical protein